MCITRLTKNHTHKNIGIANRDKSRNGNIHINNM